MSDVICNTVICPPESSSFKIKDVRRRRDTLVKNLIKGLPIFDIDHGCQWNLGAVNKLSLPEKIKNTAVSHKRIFKCHGCLQINKIVDVVNTDLNKEFMCESLRKNLKLKVYPNVGIHLEEMNFKNILEFISSFDPTPGGTPSGTNDTSLVPGTSGSGKELEKNSSSFSAPGGTPSGINDTSLIPVCKNYCTGIKSRCFKVDKFSCNVMLSSYLQSIVPSYVRLLHEAFVCGYDGFVLIENFNEINIGELSVRDVGTFVYRILNFLKQVEPYDFSLGIPTDPYILGNPRNSFQNSFDSFGSLGYFSVNEKMDIKINNLENHSVTINPETDETGRTGGTEGLRIFSENKSQDQDGKYINVERVSYMNLDSKIRILYKFNNLEEILRILNSGIPFYRSSLNVYLILIDLLKYQNIRNFFNGYNEIYEIFEKLFLQEDLPDLAGPEISLKDLEKRSLRCDALDYMLDSFKILINKGLISA
jgi:hypothetical protein